MVRPHVAVITLIAAAHLGHFRNLDEIATAKAEIFEGIEQGGTALLNRDDSRWKLLARLARAAGVEHIMGFGEHARADFRLVKCEPDSDGSSIVAKIGGRDIAARIGAPGRHVVQNALAVLGTAELVGADVGKVAARLATLSPESGRGRRHELVVAGRHAQPDRRKLQRQSGVDEGRARAARRPHRCSRPGGGSPCWGTCWSSATMRQSCMPGLPS